MPKKEKGRSHWASDYRSRDSEFRSQLGHSAFVEIDYEIFSMAILTLLLIQKRHLSVTGNTNIICENYAFSSKCVMNNCNSALVTIRLYALFLPWRFFFYTCSLLYIVNCILFVGM